jgi:outer membrane protein OmpA-like peptidoglycan-associated protein
MALAVVAVGALLSGGCARRPPLALEQARVAWEDAAADPDLAENAPEPLHEAGQTLRDAERDWDADHDELEAEHDAYVVRQRIAIARAVAEQKTYEAAARTAVASTSETRLATREHELAELRARRTGRGLEITLGDVLFEGGGAALRPDAERTLAMLADVLRDDPGRRVLVEGHTDAAGTPEYNSGLSDERANAVRDYLVAHGVGAERVVANGYGEAYPVASNDTEDGREQNRRVEVVILDRGVPTGEERRSVAGEPYGLR